MNLNLLPKDSDRPTRRDFMKRSAVALIGAKCEMVLANGSGQLAKSLASIGDIRKTYPNRVISWWSTMGDLEWPARSVRDKIQRRADQMAAANIEVAIQFGFHYRFDFAWCFSTLHGYLADVATALHDRGIRYLDHFSCNLIARPRTPEDVLAYNTHERHCVNLYPDAVAAQEAGYSGYRFNDLRETLIGSGKPTYIPVYVGESLCHNNPKFLEMHKSYLKRLFAEVPLDGLHQDDMCFYGSFATCGCRYCREKFRQQFGHELPPLSDRDFWGDTSGRPTEWGNYDNPAFRDWVRLRYQSNADHLKVVREIMGSDRILMTCCSSSGPRILNGLGLSAEEWIDVVDWIVMENVGLSPRSVHWPGIEPEAMLHKGIAVSKSPAGAPAMTLSYFTYAAGADLGWAIARFWGVGNWASTCAQGLPVDPPDGQEEAVLIRSSNQWEVAHPLEMPGRDVCDLQLAFIRASRDNGWRDSKGRDSWQRVARWPEYLTKHNLGYGFVTTRTFEIGANKLSTSLPLVLDGCAHVSDRVCQSIRDFVSCGGRLWVAPPLGTHNELARPREKSLLDMLMEDKALRDRVLVIDAESGPAVLEELIRKEQFAPRIRRISGSSGWSARLRVHGERLCLHLLNHQLQGEAHPTFVGDRGLKVLYRIATEPALDPLVLEVNCAGLPSLGHAVVVSPDLTTARPVKCVSMSKDRVQMTLDLKNVRLYAMVSRA